MTRTMPLYLIFPMIVFMLFSCETMSPDQTIQISGDVSNLQLVCTQASRENNARTKILLGDASAVERVGTGDRGGHQWGLRCVNGYQKTGCHLSVRREYWNYDLWPSPDACLTDNEEFQGKAAVSIICCKIGVSKDLPQQSQSNALSDAVLQSDIVKAKALIKEGADVNALDLRPQIAGPYGRRPLNWAALRNDVAMIEVLLKAGADINSGNKMTVFTPLHHAAEANAKEAAILLIAKGAKLNMKTNEGWTALFLAANLGHTEVAQVLIEKGADPDIAETSNRETPLIEAIEHGYPQIARLLIAKGANIHLSDNQMGGTALLWAVHTGDVATTELLIKKGADVNVKTISRGRTALFEAANRGYLKIVQLLLETGADPDIAQTVNGETPLMEAIEQNHLQIAKLLIEKGTDVHIKDHHDRTALIWAKFKGRPEIVQLLNERSM